MAAVLKKRALAEFSQVIQEEPPAKPPPFKKLRITRKATYLGIDVEQLKTRPSNEVLQLLVELLDNLPTELEDIQLVFHGLLDYFRHSSPITPIVHSRLIAILCKLIQHLPPPAAAGTSTGGTSTDPEASLFLDELLTFLKGEQSHLLISQIFSSFLELIEAKYDISRLHQRIIVAATQNLEDSNHYVQCQCLWLLSELSSSPAQIASTFRILGEFGVGPDPRVRTQALTCMLRMHKRGFQLDFDLYNDVCLSLEDDYEGVRMASLRLVHQFSFLYADRLIAVPKSQEKIRLVDDAFGKICQMINDLSMQVRVLAASLLGSMTHVSSTFLEQTLDKQLMSNLRRKRTAHERLKENYESGEWSSGSKWADDAPKETVDADSVSLMRTGACGAFVHGLEDEFMEVRKASLDSLCQLAVESPSFADQALEFLVDMFNDEIEEVRLRTIHCLTTVSPHILLREDQLDTILCVLKDYNMDIREALHSMLGVCNLITTAGLKLCVDALIDNLKRYPQDKRSIWKCLKNIGGRHPSLVLPLVQDLLGIHPFLDLPEPDVEDPTYISMLILVFNAAHSCPTMAALFEDHVFRHYSFLRDTVPSFVPVLPQLRRKHAAAQDQPETTSEQSLQFFHSVLERLQSLEHNKSPALRQRHMECAISDLQNLSQNEPLLSAAAMCACSYVECHLLVIQILSNRNWMNPSSLSPLQSTALKSALQKLLHQSLVLCYQYPGLSHEEQACFRQLRLRALALRLLVVIRSSNQSALALCEAFLEHLDNLHRYLEEHNLQAEPFVAGLWREVAGLEEAPRPGSLARLIAPLLSSCPPPPPLTMSSRPDLRVHRASATISEPQSGSDSPLRFTAGLVLPIPLDVTLEHVEDTRKVKVKVKYPDQRVDLIVPNLGHFRPLEANNYRLYTTILVSHNIWSEAAPIEISMVMDFREPCGGEEQLIPLCEPVRVLIMPKPPRKGI